MSVALLKDSESFLATTSSTTQLQNCVTFDVVQFSEMICYAILVENHTYQTFLGMRQTAETRACSVELNGHPLLYLN